MVPDSTTMIHSSWILALLMDLTLTTRWSYIWAKLFSFTFVWTLHAPLLFSLCLLLVTSDLQKQTDFWQVKTWVPVQDETFANMCIFMFQFPGGTDNYLTISGSSHPFLSSSSEVGFVLEHTSGVTSRVIILPQLVLLLISDQPHPLKRSTVLKHLWRLGVLFQRTHFLSWF